MRVFITGGAGFIGSHLADHYVNAGHQVTLLDNFSTGKSRDFLRCKGHLKTLVTNFFIAINDNECYIYRTYKHQVTTEYLSFPKSNLVYHKTF